jgi:hypothetical protein
MVYAEGRGILPGEYYKKGDDIWCCARAFHNSKRKREGDNTETKIPLKVFQKPFVFC